MATYTKVTTDDGWTHEVMVGTPTMWSQQWAVRLDFSGRTTVPRFGEEIVVRTKAGKEWEALVTDTLWYDLEKQVAVVATVKNTRSNRASMSNIALSLR